MTTGLMYEGAEDCDTMYTQNVRVSRQKFPQALLSCVEDLPRNWPTEMKVGISAIKWAGRTEVCSSGGVPEAPRTL